MSSAKMVDYGQIPVPVAAKLAEESATPARRSSITYNFVWDKIMNLKISFNPGTFRRSPESIFSGTASETSSTSVRL